MIMKLTEFISEIEEILLKYEHKIDKISSSLNKDMNDREFYEWMRSFAHFLKDETIERSNKNFMDN